jgi:hypothetical protein
LRQTAPGFDRETCVKPARNHYPNRKMSTE